MSLLLRFNSLGSTNTSWQVPRTKLRETLTKNSGNSGWDVNGTRFCGSFPWKLSGINGISEKVTGVFHLLKKSENS